MAITSISVTRKLTSSVPDRTLAAAKPVVSAVKTIMPVMPSSGSQISITGGQPTPVTVVGATRQLSAPLPVTPIQVTPNLAFSPAKTIMPVTPVNPISPVKSIMPVTPPVSRPIASSYVVPEKTQSTTTVPSVITAERAAVEQILTKDIRQVTLPKTLPVIPDMTVTGRPYNPPQAVTAKKDITPLKFNMPATVVPSSDVPMKILPAKVTVPETPALTQQMRTKELVPVLTQQPRTLVPSTGTPINPASRLVPEILTPAQQSGGCTAAMMSAGLCAGTVIPTPSRLALPAPGVVQEPSVMTSFAPLIDPLLAPQDDMTRPGVTPPDFMRVRGREERYYGREPFVETNVITPQVSMPTQVSTQGPGQSYQVPIDQGYDPNKLQYNPGTVSYVGGGAAQPGAQASLDSAYNTVKILTLAGVGLGALYWLLSKAAPKVELKQNKKNRKRTSR